MEKFSIKDLGVKVGLEIHQQLATNKKLFCNCTPTESDDYSIKFQRKLRASKSELGEFDPAALFESTKSKTIMYYANEESSCLVEQDEEPPHELDKDAKRIALIISASLKSNIFSEIYPMRKTVIDGSNTTGFQRTMLISQGGFYNVGKKKIGIQSICLEEDAAKILGEEGNIRKFGLERLGVPLVEIATEPFEVDLSEIKKIALSLGRILRSTKKVKRGLGSIRQDVNVSIKDGKGVVIEVKGVQQLDQLEKVVEYEAKRQHGLLKISKKIQENNWSWDNQDKKDITELFTKCKSKIVQNAIQKNQKIIAVSFKNMAGIFGYSPYDGIRLGKEVAELVRFFGIGGVFHSDELPNYGIEESDLIELKSFLQINENDAFLILASPEEKIHTVIDQIILRIEHIKNYGIPIDTRLATQSGETKFLRPRPGAARMYPETDIPPIIISKDELIDAEKNIPKLWDESIKEIEIKYKMNQQLAEQIFDSKYMELFENIIKNNKINSTFVASILCSTITNLERKGLDSNLLKNEDVLKLFELLGEGEIAKESIEIIFEDIMSKKSQNVKDAMKNTSLESIDDENLDKIIKDIVEKNQEIIKNQKERAIGPLMGIAMKELRGKVSGEIINNLLLKNIKKKLENN
ncbi:MAG: Glu-tRNA(Gln) amidotransferase subunit GatE [Crenarchaeota archaeon]|nr:Glu-tRNA(Gln) amidotransferase subunit GatE [Thermoproteota archaeon]HJJ22019.1 Glu-tRNA(Gln) amidotransferase subunit GatE [Nitrosopumilus sp.]MDA0853594.1 Glu-tRNA(Gln) amidotransferase subunit GatE [Thermoproteota archaeon]MDA1123194.1 Glu-tRNA(Gln) amidotransferase subunit GatE [Thermoproteota archaeon]HJJ24771.1 Glu-tRNA(Gln) amidotransferase subunit GatE [Nitrosopumilus sp.]